MSIVGAILAIGLLIVVHEAGHYLVARWCKMRVDRFSIGFGPPILSWRRNETDFTIGPIPFGGFVQINGMMVADEVEPDDEHAYPNRPAWQRFATIFAGPATNYLFAFVLALGLYSIAGVATGTSWLEVASVQSGWAAAGKLEPGDRIIKLDGEPFYARHQGKRYNLQLEIEKKKGQPIAITVLRDGRELDFELTPVRDMDYYKGGYFERVPPELLHFPYRVGIGLNVEDERVGIGLAGSFVEAVKYPVRQTRDIAVGLYDWIAGRQEGEVGGPIMIGTMLKRTFEIGWIRVIELLMLLNVYLGLFNLFPLPALDGGRLVFLGYEMTTRRRANPKIEATVHMVGMMALLVLMTLVTYKDIMRYVFQ